MDLFDKNRKDETVYVIPDGLWKNIHETYAERLKADFLDAERHINFQMQNSTMLPRAEVEKQHLEYHKRNCFGIQTGFKRKTMRRVDLPETEARIRRR